VLNITALCLALKHKSFQADGLLPVPFKSITPEKMDLLQRLCRHCQLDSSHRGWLLARGGEIEQIRKKAQSDKALWM
jgi:hypothetical protein